VGLFLLGVVLPVVVGAMAGSLEIPRNDDWSYRRISLDLARTGQLALDGASQTMIVGQILLAQPFLWLSGLQPWGFAAAGIVFATGAMVSAYVLARQILPPRVAVIPVLLLALSPGYLAYATSFMSDVPALVAEFVCLILGARAVTRRPVSTAWLVAAVAVGFFAFSIRDFAVAAPASVIVAALCAEPRRWRHWGVAIAFAAASIALYLWRATLSGQLGDVGPAKEAPGGVILAAASIAFVCAPAAIVAAIRWHRHWRGVDVVVGLFAGWLLVDFHVYEWMTLGKMPIIFLGNLSSQYGVPSWGLMLGGRPLVIDDSLWLAINVVALAACLISLGVGTGIAGAHLRRHMSSFVEFVQRFGSPQGLLLLFSASSTLGLAIYGLRFNIYDRYLWAIVPVVATLLLYVPSDLAGREMTSTSSRRAWGSAGAATLGVGILATMSIMYLVNSHAFDVARWRAGDVLARLGIATNEIDAGYEWLGYHATVQARPGRPAPDPVIWYRGWWPAFRMCGYVSAVPDPSVASRFIGTMSYRLFLVAGDTEQLYLYRVNDPGCPSTAG
jgi:hypothetical protein